MSHTIRSLHLELLSKPLTLSPRITSYKILNSHIHKKMIKNADLANHPP